MYSYEYGDCGDNGSDCGMLKLSSSQQERFCGDESERVLRSEERIGEAGFFIVSMTIVNGIG